MRTKEGLLVVQPFHPMLFRQGPVLGPKVIMGYKRGEISDEDLEQAWADAVQSTQAVDEKLNELQYPCGVCDAELLSSDFSFTFPGRDVTVERIMTQVIDLGAC